MRIVRVLLNPRGYPVVFPVITCLSLRHRFRKAPFLKCPLSTMKRKAHVFKFLPFEECFRKPPFSVGNLSRFVWTVGNKEIKLRLHISPA